MRHRDFPFYTPKGAFPVGGALRDLLLGLRPKDLDYVALDPEKAAQEAQGRLGGSLFPLDAARGHYRLVVGGLTLDFTPLEGGLETTSSGGTTGSTPSSGKGGAFLAWKGRKGT